MKAFSVADEVIEVDRLSQDSDYILEVQSKVAQTTGLVLDLTDARSSIESTGEKPYAPKELSDAVEETLAEASAHLRLAPGSPCHNFGVKLAADFLNVEANYRHFTDSMRRQLTACLADNKAILECNDLLEKGLAEATSRLAETTTRLDVANMRVRELEPHLRSIEKSASWRLTMPLRVSAALLRELLNRNWRPIPI